jgi:hypothetical protein
MLKTQIVSMVCRTDFDRLEYALECWEGGESV